MSSLIDPMTQVAFAVHQNKGVFALLLGSGISRAAEIPTGWQITLDLIRRVAESNGVKDEPDWEKYYVETEGKEPDYSDLLEKLATTQSERRSILHGYIEPSGTDREEGRKVPTDAHRAIARLIRSGHIRVIITTNFDRLIETALRDEGVEPTIIHSADALQGAEPIAHTSCYVFKIHGDYKDSRILNTEQELSNYPQEYNDPLDRIFDEYGLIICGWSAEWDHGLREAIKRAPNRRYSLFWASRRPLTAKAKDLLDFRKSQAIQIQIENANTFFTELQERVQALEETRSQNPLSIEMLLARTKKYLAKSEYRIQLADLIENETQRVIKSLEQLRQPKEDSSIAEEFPQYRAKCESASEGLAKLCGLVGRWGNDEHLSFVVGAMRKLIEYAKGRQFNSYDVTYMKIYKYPAVLIFQACLLGLVKSENWDSIRGLLLEKVDNNEKLLAWQCLFPRYFRIGDGLDNFRLWYGLPHHLHKIFSDNWAHSFLSDMSSFTSNSILLEVLVDSLEENPDMLKLFGNLAEDVRYRDYTNEILDRLENRDFLSKLENSGFQVSDSFVNFYKKILEMRLTDPSGFGLF